MASSPTDGMYYEFSIPVGLKRLIQEVIENNQNDPNTPQVLTPTAARQWFSQPRSAVDGGPPPLDDKPVFFYATPSGFLFDRLGFGVTKPFAKPVWVPGISHEPAPMAPILNVNAVTPQRISVDALPDPTDPVTVMAYYFYLNGVKVNEYPFKQPTHAQIQRSQQASSNSPTGKHVLAGFSYQVTAGHTYTLTCTAVNASGIEGPQSEPQTVTMPAYDDFSVVDMSAADKTKIDQIVAATQASAGVSIAVSGPRGTYTKCYGTNGARALTPDDHFRWGAISGTLVATAILQQIDAGHLNLHDPVSLYLDDIPNGGIITIENLLMMRSGLVDYTSDFWLQWTFFWYPWAGYSAAAAIDYAKSHDPKYLPDTNYDFVNINFIMLGAVLEAVDALHGTSRTVREILEDDIITPLGLTETSWPDNSNLPTPAASGNVFNPEFWGCGGALAGTIGDLEKWGEELRDGTLLTPASQALRLNVWRTVVEQPLEDDGPDRFAYGLGTTSVGQWVGHVSSVPGFCTTVWTHVRSGTVIAAMENAQTGNVNVYTRMFHRIAAYLFPESMEVPDYPDNLPVKTGYGADWDGTAKGDPFPLLIDPSRWEVRRVGWEDRHGTVHNAVNRGVDEVVARIKALAPGTKFGLGGWSMGALVMSLVYNEIRFGELTDRKPDLVCGITFGNPMRTVNHTWPGSRYSGGWDIKGSYRQGHGMFPLESRLVAPDNFWWDFANMDDVVTAVCDSPTGIDAQTLANHLFGHYSGGLLTLEQLNANFPHGWAAGGDYWGLITEIRQTMAGTGEHSLYPIAPPPGNPQRGLTSYQIALNYLNEVADEVRADQLLHWQFINETEVLSVNFKLPLSVSEIGFEALRVPCKIEVWYQDRLNNWRQVMDESHIPVTLTLSGSQSQAWYPAHFFTYPLVAKSIQFRFTRTPDPVAGNAPYPVGMRNGLIRRNVYDRNSGAQAIDDQQDAIGNVITSYIKDWDAAKAFDSDPVTYWRSAPMPDPDAVAALYLDCRDAKGNAQLVDTLYLDPVYTGQDLNLYYSNDETQGTLKLSPITAVSTTDENTSWQLGKGRWDSSNAGRLVFNMDGTIDYIDSITPVSNSDYQFPMAWGPLVSQDTWIGIEWAPDFHPGLAPPENPVLFSVTPPAGADPDLWWPTIFYDVGAGEMVFELTNGVHTRTFSAPLSPTLTRYAPLRIVVGWQYSPKAVFISVKTAKGVELVSSIAEMVDGGGPITTVGNTSYSTIPTQVSLDGSIGITNFRGLLTAYVIKLENWSAGRTAFQANPGVYVSPEPTLPVNGAVPASSLDNAIYAAAWATQEHGTGGDHESRYADKTWTPIWRNYLSTKGKLFFPQQISLKYLKLEFTRLTEEPYPVYDSGIQVSYQTFPVSVYQTVIQSSKVKGGEFVVGGDVMSNINSVNFLNSYTVNAAINSSYGQVQSPMSVITGPGTISTSLPNASDFNLVISRQELATPVIYKRPPKNSQQLAAQFINETASGTGPTAQAAKDGFTPALTVPTALTGLPTQGADWWVFPGASLKMPASMMQGLIGGTQTQLKRKGTTMTRLRFSTTCVHRYEVKTAIRDAAVGYFAGVREVIPMVTTHINEQDPEVLSFTHYDPTQWVMSNVKALDSGPVTTLNKLYEIVNPSFDQDIGGWTQAQGEWIWESSIAHDHWAPGSATVIADGTEKVLLSSQMDVEPGDVLNASVWTQWEGLVAADNSEAIQLQAWYYLNGEFVSSASAPLSYFTWDSSTPLIDGHHWASVEASVGEGTAFTVPEGVNQMRLALVVTADATEGQVWFDTVLVGTSPGILVHRATDISVASTLYKDFLTTSSFAKLKCNFRDSGLVRSNDMWARQDPLDTNISFTALAYYTSTIPDQVPAGMWNDTIAQWSDANIPWGAPRAQVAINVDPDRIFQGKRVLHFTRAHQGGESGVKVRQWTNYVAHGLFRLGCVFYKPTANNNSIKLRLRRLSDGVYIHEEVFTPIVGYWYEYVTDFFEIPDGEQQYSLELVCFGDDADELYLNDLYSEVALGRYFVRLGGEDAFLHDVTQLRYADSAIVSTTLPVNEASVEVAILSPKFFAYGVDLEPVYLR